MEWGPPTGSGLKGSEENPFLVGASQSPAPILEPIFLWLYLLSDRHSEKRQNPTSAPGH